MWLEEAVLLQTVAELIPRDGEQFCCRQLVAAGSRQGVVDQLALHQLAEKLHQATVIRSG